MSQFSSPPGAYQHPNPLGGPPPRPGRPWWVWVLGGCGGCALIGIIAVVVLGALGVNALQSEMKNMGPVTAQSVQQSLGSDVPIYPGSNLEVTATRAAKVGMSTVGKLGGQQFANAFKGIGAYVTPDTSDKIFHFYDTKLPALGWKASSTKNTPTAEQHTYQKGNDMLMVQVQQQQGMNVIMLMRGNMSNLRKGGGPPGS